MATVRVTIEYENDIGRYSKRGQIFHDEEVGPKAIADVVRKAIQLELEEDNNDTDY